MSTLRDLLVPNHQDTRCFLRRVDETEGPTTAYTSSFTPQLWKPERLPHSAHLCEDLPSKMLEHLGAILDQSYPDQVARTRFTNCRGRNFTPNDCIELLRDHCARQELQLDCEGVSNALSQHLSDLVYDIYYVLTGQELQYRAEQPTPFSQVVSDFSYQVDSGVHILGGVESPKVFNRFIGELIDQMGHGSPAPLCFESAPSTYGGYKAILAKLGYHAGDFQPRVRWAIVFSGLHYFVIYIPRTLGRPRLFCSSIMQFCRQPGDQEPATQPPIWSLLVYMMLVETLDVKDEALRQRLGVVVPSRTLSLLDLGSKTGAGGRKCTERLGTVKERDETQSPEGALTEASENITVQCMDASPIDLLLVNTPHSRRAKNQHHPFIHFDRHLGAGWSTVFASSESHVVVKFAAVPKKDKAELTRQLSNEKLAYNKLSPIAGWVVPRLYGEYEWYGGRALVLSDEGRSLSYLEKFTSLSLIERIILFAEVYCMHNLGVLHGDLEPPNVLRKRWSYIFKIIDFGFSDVDHTCPGWRECVELKKVRSELQLDRANFRFKSMFPGGFKNRPVAHYLVLPFIALLFSWLVYVVISGTPVNWRMWPQIR